MKKIIPLIISMLFMSIICGACSKDDIFSENENYIDTIIIADTTIKKDTIINDSDTIIKIDTIIKKDTITETILKKIGIADPYILLYDGVYYAYGTANTKLGFPVYTSENLKIWEYKGYALSVEDTHHQSLFWAPEVYYIDNHFVMFYAANRELFIAESDSPLGPFKQKSDSRMVNSYGIDPSLFIDDDGVRYLNYTVYKEIYLGELTEDMLRIKEGTNKRCIYPNPRQEWENKDRGDNEGSMIMKHNGYYYLTYSGNFYESQYYGVGLAVATNIRGPWKKVDYNPLLQLPNNLVGTGHHSFFHDKDDQLMIVFHAHHDSTTVHPREMYIAKASFEPQDEGEPDKLVIDKESIFIPYYKSTK